MIMDNTTAEKAPTSWAIFAPVLLELLARHPPPKSAEIRAFCALFNQDKHLLSIRPCLTSPLLRKLFAVLPGIPWFRSEERLTAFEAWSSKGMHNVGIIPV